MKGWLREKVVLLFCVVMNVKDSMIHVEYALPASEIK